MTQRIIYGLYVTIISLREVAASKSCNVHDALDQDSEALIHKTEAMASFV